MTAGRVRARDLGRRPGIVRPGAHNAITDVASVRVGHVTLMDGAATRAGVTAILPQGGNPYADRVPAGHAAINGFGKLAGATQLAERGEIETPIILTHTQEPPAATVRAVCRLEPGRLPGRRLPVP